MPLIKLKTKPKQEDYRLPPLIVKFPTNWSSGGVGEKPEECYSCPWHQTGKGFVGDYVGKTPKVAFMFPTPTKDDVIEQTPLSGGMGHLVYSQYIFPVGFKKADIIITHVLRCYPGWNVVRKRENYPTGAVRGQAEIACRVYDNRHMSTGALHSKGLINFNPNLFYITFNPKDRRVPAYHRQIQIDLTKVKKFVKLGYRPLVLFGNEAAELFAPHIVGKGSSKSWRGHFWEGEFKFNGNLEERGFAT